MNDGSEAQVLRPNRRVFLWRPVLRRAILFIFIALGLHFFLPLFVPVDPGLLIWLAVAGLLITFTGVDRLIAYGRTSYHFHDDRLVVKTGTIATRNTIDLPYRNVTQVVLRLPFVERRFFSTGHLAVHAAGSAQGVAQLKSVDNPREIYDRIADRLRDNGFSLQRKKRLQREKPHWIGTLLDTSGMALAGLIALVTIGMSVGGAVIDMLDLANFYELFDVLMGAIEPDDADDPDEAALALRGTLGLAILAMLAGTAGLAKLAIHFVDLNRRTYTLWDDVVDYEDGFLTETYKFIPIENLADTATEEPFLKRLFGMADVNLSPHGSASGIRFPSMPQAAQFRRHLDRLIESTEGRSAEAPAPTGELDGDDDQSADVERSPLVSGASRRLPDVDAPALEFEPYLLRRAISGVWNALKLPTLIAVVALIGYAVVMITGFDLAHLDLPVEELSMDFAIYGLGSLAGVLIVYQLAKAIFYCWTTNYRVGRRKVTWERDFISRDEFEFTNDKISSVTVERDVVDRLMGTATLSFRSIGNATPLVFEDIRRADKRLDEIRRRLGIFSTDDDALAVHRPRVNILDFLWARLFSTLFMLALAGGAVYATTYWPDASYAAIFFAAVPVLVFIRDLFYYPRCRVQLFDDHLCVRRGIFFVEEDHVPYDQIRSIATTRYPGRRRGVIQIIPASMHRVPLSYVDDLEDLHATLDDHLYDHPMRPVRQPAELDCGEVSRRQPMARNGVALLSIWTLLLALITVVPVLLLYLRARRTLIVVEEARLRRQHGLLYRTTQTVLANRIDQILIRQGPTHTIFRNSLVNILTVGSSLPELRLGPVPDGQTLYDEIETRLPKG